MIVYGMSADTRSRARRLLMMKHSPIAHARSRAVYRYTKREIRLANVRPHAYMRCVCQSRCVCVCVRPDSLACEHILSLADAASKSKS